MNKIIQEDLKYITSNNNINWEILKNKTVLITGAFGFLASYITRTLLYLNQRDMNIKIIGITRDISKHREWEGTPNLTIINEDVCKINPDNISQNIDYIIHASSQATPKVFGADPVGTILPNVIGTYHMLELARKQKSLEKFLFISTTGVLGFHPNEDYPLKEDNWGILDPTNVSSCYLESKRMGENLCMAYYSQHGVPIQIARPGGTYGPGLKLDDGRVFADLISNIVKKEDIVLYSDGLVKRDYLYIADATIGFFKIMLSWETGQSYNVSSSKDISIIELAELLAYVAFPELGLKVILKKDRDKDFMRANFQKTLMDNLKLRKLGWKEKTGLIEGFRRTVESYYG